MISPTEWRGYFAAAVTPFDERGRLDERGLGVYLDWLVAEGMHGIVLAGTNGEWPALERHERRRLFELGREAVPAGVPLLGGCGSTSLAETRHFLDLCADLRMDGALVSVPAYVHPTDREVVYFFGELSKGARVPIVAYNWPAGTARDLSPDVLEEVASLDNVAAVKNSTPDLGAFVETLRRLRGRVKVFGIMPGDLGLGLLEGLGGDGCIGAAGTLGRLQPGFFDAYWAGDRSLALARGAVDQDLMASLFKGFAGRYGHAVATFKELLRQRGLPVGSVRPPLLDLDERGVSAVREFLKRHDLLD